MSGRGPKDINGKEINDYLTHDYANDPNAPSKDRPEIYNKSAEKPPAWGGRNPPPPPSQPRPMASGKDFLAQLQSTSQ
ncbi:hypothetical protein HDU97_001212 [Phlyctochytrium planicorne]|nr:hypothetical protein HDU97_001212 [Phlyctochytrium planicorne]